MQKPQVQRSGDVEILGLLKSARGRLGSREPDAEDVVGGETRIHPACSARHASVVGWHGSARRRGGGLCAHGCVGAGRNSPPTLPACPAPARQLVEIAPWIDPFFGWNWRAPPPNCRPMRPTRLAPAAKRQQLQLNLLHDAGIDVERDAGGGGGLRPVSGCRAVCRPARAIGYRARLALRPRRRLILT